MKQELNSNSQVPLLLRAQRINGAVVLFLLLFAVFLAVAIWGYFRYKGILWQVGLMLIPAALFYIAAAGWRVEITPDNITVVTFFRWRKSVRRADITNWAIKTGWKAGDRIKDVPYSRIEIYTDKKAPPFMIAIKPLSRENINKLKEQLPPKKAAK